LYIGFRLVPKSVTLNDLELRNGPILRISLNSCTMSWYRTSRSLSHLLMSYVDFYLCHLFLTIGVDCEYSWKSFSSIKNT